MTYLEITFVTEPVCNIDTIVLGANGSRILVEGETIAPGEIAFAGKKHWNNVLVKNLDKPIGEKFDTLLIDRWKLHGIIPIYKKDGITECIYDYAEIINV